MPIEVTDLALAPVKGMRLSSPDEVHLEHYGPAGDRDFLVLDRKHALLLTQRTPALLRVAPTWEPDRGVLTLRFPDGRCATDVPSYGAWVSTSMYDGRRLSGRLVGGVLSDALSEFLGKRVHLLRRDPAQTGADDYPVTLMSTASLGAVAARLGRPHLQAQRFRMTLTVRGAQAWEEHGWSGGEVTVGAAVLRVAEPVQRCVVTTRDPSSGVADAKVLHALATLRGRKDVTFGIWCTVAQPGRVRRGDLVAPHPR